MRPSARLELRYGSGFVNIVGPRVKQIRQSQDLKQAELVARCNLIGWDITRSTLAKIECRVRRVTDEEAALLARALKVGVEELYP